jgi:lipopolysaccharide/colanic/teichoic acid biosynthesis glycosyltransferase
MESTFFARLGKRWFDVVVSSVGLLVLSPLLLLIALAVRLSSPGPALFSQIRTGLFEKPFHILKFRTMRMAPQDSGSLITASGDPRITPLGCWLRKTKLDELPQLFNVFFGHMSLVGPRPEVPLYTSRYTDRQKEVFSARPGITGPFIVFDEEELLTSQADRERFYLTVVMPAKLEVQLAYCANIRFSEDLRILFYTLASLFRRPDPRSSPSGPLGNLPAVSGMPGHASQE